MSYDEAVRRIDEAQKSNATHLDLGGLGLERLPETISKLNNLVYLGLYANSLTILPESIGQLKNLKRLDLVVNKLKTLPDSIGRMVNLRRLDLANNEIEYLPDSIGQMKNLSLLNLYSNRVESLPDTLGKLGSLAQLEISDSLLKELPDSIGKLASLDSLTLYGNFLSFLPDTICQLSNLRYLNISRNQLRKLPNSIGKLSQLDILEVSRNKLIELPDSIGELHNLEVLNVQENRLEKLPRSIFNLGKLKELYLHGNNSLKIPTEVLGKSWNGNDNVDMPRGSPSDILNYYFRLSTGRRSLNEAKLILVGRGGVGKTSLVNRLVENRFEPDEQKTEGIKITGWEVPIPRKNRTVRLNVWDFGGQEIMHATHQFFLTSRSLYLLVLSGREESEEWDADYWLRLIESFGDGSPVIVVLNKYKQHKFDVDRRALQRKFPFIKEFVETDCQKSFGITKLERVIKTETDRLKDVYAEFPKSWFDLKERMAKMKENYLSLEEFQKACASLGVEEEDDQQQLAKYLHDLGIAINFQDDARLCDTHVLNPHWVTGGIYAVLNSKRLAENKGFFNSEDVGAMLPPKGYPKPKHVFLVELMKKFDLCFSLRDHDSRYLIPERLDEQEPEAAGEFKPEDCLNFQYHYPVLPKGLLPRFIVRTHALSEGEERWRTGVILKRDGCRALVKADIQDKRMFIRVSGAENRRRELLAVIRNEFDIIHGDIKGLKPDEMIPLPGYPKEVVSYQELLTFEAEGESEYRRAIDGKVVRFSVKALLDGVGRPKPARHVVIETLANLMESQLDSLKVHLPPKARKFLAGGTASPATRAASIIEWAETPGGCGLEIVAECIDAVTDDSSWRKSRRHF